MNIIGINGFKRSGKGETGNAIESLVLGVRQLGFADKLKTIAARSLGFTDPEMTDAERIALMDEAKEHWVMDILNYPGKVPSSRFAFGPPAKNVKSWTGRQLLQYMGTEARIVFGEDFWVDQVLPNPRDPGGGWFGYEARQHMLHAQYPGVSTLVFTDMRFENEAQRIIDLGGFNVRVHRPGAESDGHASELVLPDRLIHYEIQNDRGLEDLRWEINKVLELEGLV
jgi:hypothetical protein